MADGRMARADLVTGIVLFVLSVAVIYGAWTMDRLEIRRIHPSSVPGLTPGLLGLVLAVCSALLILKSLRPAEAKGRQSAAAGPDAGTNPSGGWRLGLAVVLCLVYALVLVGWTPFWLATAIFVTAFILAFEWVEARSPGARLLSLVWALAVGLATGWSVAYAFSELFLVRLP